MEVRSFRLFFVFFFFFFFFSFFLARPEFSQRRVCILGPDGNIIASKQFKSPVLSVQFSSKGHIAVATSNCIYWFRYLENNEAVKCVPTPLNIDAVCAISDDGHLLAFPSGPNMIDVWHGSEKMAQITTSGGVSKLRFNPKGAGQDLLAATSDGGKQLFVWSLNRIEKKAVLRFEFSRSRTHSQVQVNGRGKEEEEKRFLKFVLVGQGLDFNSLSSLIALSTDSGTVHVFELSDQNAISSTGGGLFGSVTSWIPSVVVPAISSKYQVRLKTRGPALSSVMVFDLPGEELGRASSRSVYVLTFSGLLHEFTLPDATSPVTDTDLPLRSLKIFS